MPAITTDPLKAAKLLADVLSKNGEREVAARWKLAWTVLFVADRAAMANAIEEQHGKTIANAFRNSATVVKAMAAGYGGEMPPDDVREHVERWAPKTWQQCTAGPIRVAAENGTLIDTDPTVLRREVEAAKDAAKQAEGDSPQGESPPLPKELVTATMTCDDLANAVLVIASREPQWGGLSAKQQQQVTTNILGEVAALASAKISNGLTIV